MAETTEGVDLKEILENMQNRKAREIGKSTAGRVVEVEKNSSRDSHDLEVVEGHYEI